MRRIGSAFILLCLSVLMARAQENLPERDLKTGAGQDLRVGVYADIHHDCSLAPLPTIRLVTPPAHGAVIIKRGKFKADKFRQCFALEAPALIAFYRPARDFSGSDQFDLEVLRPDGRKQFQHFRIDVGNGTSDQGI